MRTLDVLVVGEAFVDFVPLHRGRLRESESFELHSGGAPCNVAIGLARLGSRSALVSVVGDDEFGHFVRRALDRDGVDTTAVRVEPGVQTGLCFITLDADGERSFLHRGGDTAERLRADHFDLARVRAAGAVLFTASSLRQPAGVAAIHKMIDHAGGLVCCDPGGTPRHWGHPDLIRSRTLRALARCDVVKCAAAEATALTGEQDPVKATRALVDHGAWLAVVTLGAEGALWARPEDAGHVPAPDVDVVDTTGAGDGFMAGLLHRLASESARPEALPEARLVEHLRFACSIGAAVVTRRGAVQGLPDLRPVPTGPLPKIEPRDG
ncbi:MAG: carbohydrate kinase [Myxococcales bacterium]|nr:carbohydrate kinase [Myxococcales bacterium]